MKKLILFLGLTGMVLFTSCKIGSDSDSTPQLNMVKVYLNGDEAKTIDTLKVGDQLVFTGSINGLNNPLDSVRILNDKDVSLLYFSDLSFVSPDVLNNSKTNVDNGFFYMAGLNQFALPFTVNYTPTQASKTAKIIFAIYSHSKYSPNILYWSLPSKN